MKPIMFPLLLCLVSCGIDQTKQINEHKGTLSPMVELIPSETKKFALDSVTAPRPTYMQIFMDSLGNQNLTFLNNYNNAIYSYDYENVIFKDVMRFRTSGPNRLEKLMGYYIKSPDSIYVYSKLMKIYLVDSMGTVIKNLSMISRYDPKKDPRSWSKLYPEYWVQTVTPFIDTKKKLLLIGQFAGDMPHSILNEFKFMAHMDYGLDSLYFTHTYPEELYGHGYSWGGTPVTEVYPALNFENETITYSFPVSHYLYVSDLNGNKGYNKVYGGSNFAGTITSLKKAAKNMEGIDVVNNFVRQDKYCAILHDRFRGVYYRFIRRGIPNAPKGTHWNNMNIAIIIMDEDFKYLGETTLGPEKQWNWTNSLVTKEGLNIEYVDQNDVKEEFLSLKVFNLKEK